MSLSTIRTDFELISIFMPAALDHCDVMRHGDIENASVIIGAAIWSTFNNRERRQVGILFKLAVQENDLPLRLVPDSKSSSLKYRLKQPIALFTLPTSPQIHFSSAPL